MKVVFCTPSLAGPTAPYIKALEDSIPLFHAAGIKEAYVQELGCPYISHARATMTRKALDAGADSVIYLDYDLSWDPQDLLTLATTEGDVVAATYRYKKDEEEYMGSWYTHANGVPQTLPDGNVRGFTVPAGFMKVTRKGIRTMMKAYPKLVYGDAENPSFDLFNHGAIDGTWYGEDMAFSKRWIDIGGTIVLLPYVNLNHHSAEKEFKGNLSDYFCRLPQPEKEAKNV